MSHSFAELIEAIEQCHAKLNQHGHFVSNDQFFNAQDPITEQQWQQSLDLLEQRALFLAQLSSIIDTLNPQQIDIVGQLYESMLAADQAHLAVAHNEKLKTRDSLRAIKNAEKALPAYRANNSKFLR